jgi:RND family efflux transporter MFP subunit
MTRILPRVLPFLILFFAVMTFSYLKSTRAVLAAEPPQERTWIVETLTSAPQRYQTSVTALGTIVAGRTAVLRPEVPGKLVELSPEFRDGVALTEGTLLLEIDPFDYETTIADAQAALVQATQRLEQLQTEQKGQRSQLSEAEQSEKLAATEVRRQKELVQRGVTARRALDDATRALNTAAQNVAGITTVIRSLESQIGQQERAIERAQLAVARAERDLADTRITAPFDGFLANPNAALGQQVGNNDTLGQLVAAKEMEVRFALSEADFAALGGPTGALLNKAVKMIWSPGAEPLFFDAQITRQSAQTVAASGGIEMFARLQDTDLSSPLRPGMFVSVEIAEAPLENAVAVPTTALLDGIQLFVVTEDEQGDSRLAVADFTLLRRRDGFAYLRTNLPAGTQVVTRTFPQIVPGLKVTPRPIATSPSAETNP